MRAAVLGGGISGCTLAAELAASGSVDVTLFERSPRLGGLHRSVETAGYVFDIGAFVFEDDHTMFSVFPHVRAMFVRVPNRYGSVRSGGYVDEYPLTPRGLREQFGTGFLARVTGEILMAKLTRARRDSVPAFVEYYIGPTLYRRSGLKTYIERLYLAPDHEIGLEFAQKRLAAIAESAGLRVNLARVVRELSRGRSALGQVGPITAQTVQVRPPEGFDRVYLGIGGQLEQTGVRVRLGEAPQRLRRRGDGFSLEGVDGDPGFDRVFSTIPLEIAARLMGLAGFATPDYMDLYSLFYEYEGVLRFPHNVLHNFTEHGRWKRVTVFSRYYGRRSGRDYFTVEGTLPPDVQPSDAVAHGARDFESWMRTERLMPDPPRLLDAQVTRRAYPIYRTRAAREVLRLKDALRERGILLAGRQGGFNYISSADAAADARELARRCLGGG